MDGHDGRNKLEGLPSRVTVPCVAVSTYRLHRMKWSGQHRSLLYSATVFARQTSLLHFTALYDSESLGTCYVGGKLTEVGRR